MLEPDLKLRRSAQRPASAPPSLPPAELQAHGNSADSGHGQVPLANSHSPLLEFGGGWSGPLLQEEEEGYPFGCRPFFSPLHVQSPHEGVLPVVSPGASFLDPRETPFHLESLNAEWLTQGDLPMGGEGEQEVNTETLFGERLVGTPGEDHLMYSIEKY